MLIKQWAKKFSSKLPGKFLCKVANEETNINNKRFNEYFKYEKPSYLAKDQHNVNKTMNEKNIKQCQWFIYWFK